MSNEDEEIDGKSKITNILLIVVLLVALGWVNYLYFSKHISSNPERINNFIAVDNNINKFRIPVSAVFFYPYSQNGSKILASQTNPRILVAPYTGYLYSKQNVAKAYNWLLPWKGKIKNVVLVAQNTNPNLNGIFFNKHDIIEGENKKLRINTSLNEFLQKQTSEKVFYRDAGKEQAITSQIPLINNIFGARINFATIVYSPNKKLAVQQMLLPFVKDKNSLLIFSADMSGHYTEPQGEQSAENIDLVVDLAREAHLYPKVFDLVNFEDMEEQNYRLLEIKNEKPLTTLEQELESLNSYAHLYGADLLKIAKVSLDEAVLYHKSFKPERENYPDVLFNRGAAFVNLYKDGKLRGSSGMLLPSQAVAFAVAQSSYAAALEDKNFTPITKSELSQIKINLNLLTGFEKVKYKNEADLLRKLHIGSDGLVIRDGNRQGVFLPSEWKNYPKPQEFLNNLKIKTGMSPAYWSNRIKVYRFKAVEISRDEN